MNSKYNIHGLHLQTVTDAPFLSDLLDQDLKAFQTKKKLTSPLRLIFTTAPCGASAAYPARFQKHIAERIMTRETFTHHFRQNLITTITSFKKKKIEILAASDPSLFPDPACYFCLTQPISPWLKQKGLFFLHAGCVAEKDNGILIIGSSGAGKSTLTCSALRGGFQFLSDEQPLLSVEKNKIIARAFPRRVRMDRLPASLFPELRPVLKSSKAERLVFHAGDIWPESQKQAFCHPRVLLFPRFLKSGTLKLKKIHPSVSLARLLQDDHLVWYQDGPWKNLSRLHLELLNRLAAGTRAYEITYGVRDILKIPSVFRKLLHG